MFYIKEFFFRVMYCVFGGISLFLVSWVKIQCLQTFYFGYILETIKHFSVDQSIHFIYTVPFELIDINLQFCIFLSCFAFFALIVETLFNFFKSSFFFNEFFFCCWIVILTLILLYLYNNWVLYDGLTLLISFLKIFLTKLLEFNSFNLFLELKLQDYVSFLKCCFFYLQLLYVFFILLCLGFNLLAFSTILVYKMYLIYCLVFLIIFISPLEFVTLILVCIGVYCSFELFTLVISCFISGYTFYISTFYKKLK